MALKCNVIQDLCPHLYPAFTYAIGVVLWN